MLENTTPPVDFTLPTIDGQRISLSESRKDRRVAVVVFWSSICSHCVRYDSYLNDLAARDDLALLVVASRQNEDVPRLRSAAAERGIEFSILYDADRTVARAWQVEQTPRVFLIDADEKIRYRGAIDNFTDVRDPAHEAYLSDALEDLFAGREIRQAETPSFGCPIESVYYDLP